MNWLEILGAACIAYGVTFCVWFAVTWFRHSLPCRCGRGTTVCAEHVTWDGAEDCVRCDHLRECHE